MAYGPLVQAVVIAALAAAVVVVLVRQRTGGDRRGLPAARKQLTRPMGYVRLLRHRPVFLLWVAQTLSVLGDRLYALAVMWLVWQATGSAALMGMVAVVESVPYVVIGVFGRRLLARFAALGPLAWVDLARAVAVGTLPLLWHADTGGVLALLIVVGVLGVLGAIFDPNLSTLVPEFVEHEQVQQVTGLLDLTGRIARVVGPGSAGALLLVLPEIHLYTVDAVTFVVSAVALGWLSRATGQAVTPAREDDQRREPLPRALPLLRRNPQVTLAISMHGLGLFCSAASAIGMPILLSVQLHVGAGGYGLVTAAAGLGALLGNPLAGHLRVVRRFPYAYCAAWAVSGLALAATGLAHSLAAVMATAAVGGLCAPLAAVSMSTHLADRFARPERLRLIATDQTVIRAAGTAGMLLIPSLVAADPPSAFAAAGVAMAVAALLVLAGSARLVRTTAAETTVVLAVSAASSGMR
ncbi:MAG: MFS transporter [Egibacteraceae bacterium]